MDLFTCVFILVVVLIFSNYALNKDAKLTKDKPIRKIGNNQKFIKAFMSHGEFQNNSFDCTIVCEFTNERISFTANGYVVVQPDHSIFPQITSTWCATLERELELDELEKFIGFVFNHDEVFKQKLLLCLDIVPPFPCKSE